MSLAAEAPQAMELLDIGELTHTFYLQCQNVAWRGIFHAALLPNWELPAVQRPGVEWEAAPSLSSLTQSAPIAVNSQQARSTVKTFNLTVEIKVFASGV